MGGVTSAYYANHILTFPDPKSIPHTGLVAMLVGQNDITKTVVADRILLQAVGGVAKYEPVNGPSLYVDAEDWGVVGCMADAGAVTILFVQAVTMIAMAVTAWASVLYRKAPRRLIWRCGFPRLSLRRNCILQLIHSKFCISCGVAAAWRCGVLL